MRTKLILFVSILHLLPLGEANALGTNESIPNTQFGDLGCTVEAYDNGAGIAAVVLNRPPEVASTTASYPEGSRFWNYALQTGYSSSSQFVAITEEVIAACVSTIDASDITDLQVDGANGTYADDNRMGFAFTAPVSVVRVFRIAEAVS